MKAFGQLQFASGTALVEYKPVVEIDVVKWKGIWQLVNITHHCITCMKEYENKSLEELRLEDYKAGRKGPASGSGNEPLFGVLEAFGQLQIASGTALVEYKPLVGFDVMVSSGTSWKVNTKHQCITCMKEYENKSLEELRLEDYKAGRKGPASGLFGCVPQRTGNKPLFVFGGSDNYGAGKKMRSTRISRNNNLSKDGIKCEFSMPTSVVKMPSGELVFTTIPAKKCFCKTLSSTKLIPLRPEGKLSQLEYKVVTKEMNNSIKKYGSQNVYSSYYIVSVHKLVNCCLWNKFCNRQSDISKENGFVNQRMLFHGSSAVDDILRIGFDERHSNAGGMFGAGVYFAEHSSKSNQYVGKVGCPIHRDKNCYICERKMLLCRVTLGKEHRLTQANKLSHPPPGFHSVAGVPSAGGLRYPEYVIYRGEQAYPEYLIAYKIVK